MCVVGMKKVNRTRERRLDFRPKSVCQSKLPLLKAVLTSQSDGHGLQTRPPLAEDALVKSLARGHL
jgi:hypothetical protein